MLPSLCRYCSVYTSHGIHNQRALKSFDEERTVGQLKHECVW